MHSCIHNMLFGGNRWEFFRKISDPYQYSRLPLNPDIHDAKGCSTKTSGTTLIPVPIYQKVFRQM